MFGAELYELLNFFKQVGLALSGASCFWGSAFLFKSYAAQRQGNAESGLIFESVARKLMCTFSIGFIVAFAGWFALWQIVPAFAHEGIRIVPTGVQSQNAFSLTLPVYIFWIGLTAIFLIKNLISTVSINSLKIFFIAQFLIVFGLISLYSWTGDVLGREQIFFYFHGFHSIFTLGTVLVLDFMFISAEKSLTLKRHIFPMAPLISKVIFVGLGLDFLSVTLIFGEAVDFSVRFFVAQTIVGILIINGVILSGPITRKMLSALETGTGKMPAKWNTIANICGTISIISWISITFIDFFENLTLGYSVIMTVYFSLIVVAFTLHAVFEKYFLRE
ncbi:MAG: hypothetical protein COV70_01260 [Parcubacteria group bacterium CG11_big_fil_rev_8_21_14_0_20_39_22]|nr:MAG: hypothetical protein COV70_01260 [Parcubacteria group bacterium CG11_big_fil_rev_8_21_14_0_20_39_22]